MRPPTGPATALLAAAIATMLVPALARSALADSRPSPPTFTSLIDWSTLVIVVTVGQVGPNQTTLEIEHVLKGRATSPLVLPARETDVDLAPAERAVLAFRTLDLDPRAGTIVWEIGPSGELDPRHFQQDPGLPGTIDELLTEFGIDQRSPPPEPMSPSADAQLLPSGGTDPWSVVAGALAALLVVAIGLALISWRSGTANRP
jgi:hypothetical protein